MTMEDDSKVPPPKLTPYPELFANVRIAGDLLADGNPHSWTTIVSPKADHHKYVVWLGCQILRTAHLAETLDDILGRFTVDHVTLGGPSSCCGTVHEGRGDIAIGESMTRHTVSKFDAFTPEQMLYWCPSCDNHLRIKGEAFATETTRNRKSVVGFLANIVPAEAFICDVPLKVAVHAHHGFTEQDEDVNEIGRILSKIPKLEVIDMPSIPDIGRHCSDAMVKGVGREKYFGLMSAWISEAKKRGANRVVSIYHSCHRHLVMAQLDIPADQRIKAVNYLTLMAQSLNLSIREDKFQKFTSMESTDQIMGALSERIEKLGMEPIKARRAIQAYFGRK
jgi:Fe-S oxidoreductase